MTKDRKSRVFDASLFVYLRKRLGMINAINERIVQLKSRFEEISV